MILRNFLFLDTATVEDYLSALEGSVIEGPIDQTDVERKEKGGKAGYKIVEGSVGSESSTETKQKLVINDAGRFQRLFEILEEQDAVQFLDAFDDEIWSQLRRGEILEIQANIKLPEAFSMLQLVDSISPLMDIMKAFDKDPLADPKTRAAFEGIQAISKLSENQHIPLLFEATSTPKFRFVSQLPRKYLRCELTELQGEATVFGKVQRILQKEQKFEAFSMVPALASLPNLTKQQRRKMQKDMADKNIAEIVKGPAIILTPVAVYR